jgi:acyl carrier protein
MTTTNIENTIHQFLTDRFPSLGPDLAPETSLSDGSIDSLGILEIVNFLDETFDIETTDEDFDEQNFESIQTLAQFVRSKTSG